MLKFMTGDIPGSTSVAFWYAAVGDWVVTGPLTRCHGAGWVHRRRFRAAGKAVGEGRPMVMERDRRRSVP